MGKFSVDSPEGMGRLTENNELFEVLSVGCSVLFWWEAEPQVWSSFCLESWGEEFPFSVFYMKVQSPVWSHESGSFRAFKKRCQ